MSSSTCSAPGKILLTGGYLVLDPQYSGLVLSLSARIYCTSSLTHDDASPTITVRSPQFPDAIWSFSSSPSGELAAVTNLENQRNGDNPFVRESLAVTLEYLGLLPSHPGLDISIYADNQYYSLPPTPGSRFTKSDKSIGESPKTGLGSSAALVTSLVASLFTLLSPASTSPSTDNNHDNTTTATEKEWESRKEKIHWIAQIAHCKAQGKVGSGFDVAAAVFGNLLYSRFSPSLIDSLPSHPTCATLCALIDNCSVNDVRTLKRQQVTLRKGLSLVMGDVAKGSSTPNMVRKVLASPKSLETWPSLAISNELLTDFLTESSAWPTSATSRKELQGRVREASGSVRALLKQMGVDADVEIEPDEVSDLMDRSTEIDGVICAGVPGAGGNDAIYAIVESDNEQAKRKLKDVWKRSGVQVLDVTCDGYGFQVEVDFTI